MSIYLSFGALFVKWIRARSIFKAFKREIEREREGERERESEEERKRKRIIQSC